MPRRNKRTARRQVQKPLGGRVRTPGFWHSLSAGIADGILTQEEIAAKG